MDNIEGTAKKNNNIINSMLKCLLNISYRDRITNIKVRNIVTKEIGPHSQLLAMVIAKKLRWFGHVIRSNSMSKTILQGSIEGKRRWGRPKMQWQDENE